MMEKVFADIERRLGGALIVIGALGVLTGFVYFLWHLWMIGGMMISIGRELRKK